jgi:hypothetical protein
MDVKIYPKNWGIRMEYKSFMEALKGKQHKIDKNKNGEIDAHDFKLLRKEEEELDEIHRMKTKLNSLDPISAKSVARQKLSNLVKSGHGKGALIANKMRTLNMGDDIDQEDLDALHEVLSQDAGASDWIHDFVHSTNPKFEGKTKKERIKMALGAYYDKANDKARMVGEGNGYDDNRRGFGKAPREDDEYHVPDPTVKKSKMKKEEVELEEGRNEGDVPFDKPYKTVTTPAVKDKSGAVHTPMSRARTLARQAMNKQKPVVPVKEETETSQKHEMAETQLHFIKYAAEEILEFIEMGGEIEEWYQNKLSKVQSEVESLHSYIEGESRRTGMKEEAQRTTGPVNVDKVHAAGQEPHEEKWVAAKKKPVKEEVQKADIPAYLRKAKGETPLKLADLKRKDTISDPENLARNRGVKESFDDEGNVTSNQKTFKEFAMMLEYESKDGVYRNKGTYGGNYVDPEGADDADDKKPSRLPAVKRGRGRPAGAKSGARKITGTSKLFK